MLKLGLLGSTGVGKDTCIKIIQKQLTHLSTHFIRLAEPLYDAQNYIYKICQKEKDSAAQDGILLNFLGSHMRKIAPDVLKRSFMKNLEMIDPMTQLVFCCDARPIDVPFLKEEGFSIIHIEVDPEIALKRRQLRGDLSLGSSTHSTEMGFCSELYDYQILNNGTLQDFREKIVMLITQLATYPPLGA